MAYSRFIRGHSRSAGDTSGATTPGTDIAVSIPNVKSSTPRKNLSTRGAAKQPNLSYPLNVDSDRQQGHYIMFHILQSGHGKIAKKANKKLSDINKATAASLNLPPASVGTNANAYESSTHTAAINQAPPQALMVKRGANWTVLTQAITLYMPPSVKVSYKTNYQDADIGVKAGAAAGAIEAFMGGVGSGAKSMVSGAGMMALAAAVKGADVLAPGAAALAQISTGTVIGSKVELLFQGVGRRDFQYTFTFIPKSAIEAAMVAKIIYAFKINMLPEYRSGKFSPSVLGKKVEFDVNKGGRLLVMPNAFDINYMYLSKENHWINKISSCYLTSMDVEYGGDKFVTYPSMQEPISKQDGPPPQRTVVSLSFSEIEILTRESVDAQRY